MQTTEDIFNVGRFLSPASFWSPEALVESAWHQHAPFAFWLMENLRPQLFVELGTHHGFSYLALCQAARQAGLDTNGCAVDTWRGDEHAGFYDETVYTQLRAFHDPRYGGFSRLMRSTFGEALPHFADKSIDLLHIDGRHFYDDVHHDFASWKGKLSGRAVVLFHDTEVRERGFGVFRLWEELRRQYPAFAFVHGHGLGVLGVGPEQPEGLSRLFAAGSHSAAGARIRESYARLGSAVEAHYRLARQGTALHAGQGEVVRLHDQEEAARQRLLERAAEAHLRQIAALQAELASACEARRTAERDLAAEREVAARRAQETERLTAARRSAEEAYRSVARRLSAAQESAAAAEAGLGQQLAAARKSAEDANERAGRELAQAQALLGDLQRRTASTRWLLRAIAGKAIHAPRDVSRRIRRSWRKRRGRGAATTVRNARNGFDLGQLRNPRYRKYITSRLVLQLEPVLPRSYARRMRNRMEKHVHLLQELPAGALDPGGVRAQGGDPGGARAAAEHDLRSIINFEYGNKPGEIVSELIDRHFLGNAATRWAPRQLTPDLLKEWSDELKALLGKIDPGRKPVASIIIPVHNQVVFTLLCVKSILLFGSKYPYEIIIGDDCSTDETQEIFMGCEIFRGCAAGLKYVRHVKNEGFLGNCNSSAEQATGEFLVLLNNDTVVLPGWLDALIDTFQEHENIGLAGSRLVYPDGRLQEAGGIIFADGSGHNFGRYGNPSDPRYTYMRDVDYVSGASIALPAPLWRRLGGFDPRYSPAYYEDTDLAFRIREAGLRVAYQPCSTVVHFEGVSHGVNVNEGTKRYQEINREKFKDRWRDVLPSHGHPTSYPVAAASRNTIGRILVVDAETPFPDRDSGSLDAFNYMKILRKMGFHVSFSSEHQSWDGQYSQNLRALGVEVLFRPFWTSIEEILRAHGSSLDFVFLYRAPLAKKLLRLVRQYAPRAHVVFDTVDLHFLRMEREAILKNSPKLAQKAAIMKDIELEVIAHADATIVLSTYEKALLGQLAPNAAIYQIPLVRDIPPLDSIPFKERKDIVFIGGFRHPPNIDAVQWFAREVWPRVREKGLRANFIIIGSDVPPEVQALSAADIEVRGFVSDLAEALGRCRVSIAPLRYGAGLKGKIVSCLSQGLPVVASRIAVEGAGLVDDLHVLVCDDPDIMAGHIARLYTDEMLWERLAKAGYSFCVENYSLQAAEAKLRNLLSDLGNAPGQAGSSASCELGQR